jgi:hypothetical protein
MVSRTEPLVPPGALGRTITGIGRRPLCPNQPYRALRIFLLVFSLLAALGGENIQESAWSRGVAEGWIYSEAPFRNACAGTANNIVSPTIRYDGAGDPYR